MVYYYSSFKKLMGLLQSPHLEVRMVAGETLALVLECGRSHDEEFLEDYLGDLIDAVKQLATDSHKYRAKRDRKAQRATFRDVLRYLEVSYSFYYYYYYYNYYFCCLLFVYVNKKQNFKVFFYNLFLFLSYSGLSSPQYSIILYIFLSIVFSFPDHFIFIHLP